MDPLKICVLILLVSLTFGAGLQINRANFIEVLKNYGLLGRVLLANVVIVPLLGAGLVALFHLPEYVAIGIMLMAICPGVPFALQAAGREKGGSVGLAIVMIVVLQAVSVITVPLTLNWILPDDAKAHLEMGSFVVKLILFQIVPLLLGYLVAERATPLADKLKRPVLLIFAASALALVALLGDQMLKSLEVVYGSGGLFASLILVILSLVVGWLLGGPQIRYRRTLAIATTLRNIGLASVVATSNFSGTDAPETVIDYLIIQFVICTIVGVIFARTAKEHG